MIFIGPDPSRGSQPGACRFVDIFKRSCNAAKPLYLLADTRPDGYV
jgi:hypothetical protein